TVLFHMSGYRTFKHFYLYYVKEHLRDEFPVTVSYNRFTELMQSNMLHIVINDKGELLDFVITQANENDRAPLKEGNVLKKIFGSLYADKGYISKELVEMLFDQGLHLVTGIRNNMKNVLMDMRDKILIDNGMVLWL
ncbi:transposase, partial [Arenibacter sp. F26102]|uniref:transposase n=1 Tax=Arenibacter sp. F26102 TaxID=2926416 RepID=UPI001FF58C4E